MGIQPRTLEGEALPPSLRQLPEPPARLFLHGSLPAGPRVAVVGTRQPTADALNYAGYLATWLAERGVVVLSGGAKGIDAAVHRAALAVSGATVVVAPSSFDHPFPPKHRELYDEIVAGGGGHLSHFERGVAPARSQFFQRNGLLVALAQALIVVEAPLRSGARNAAKWARRLGRPCFVVPSAPWNERGLGCIRELQLGGRALAVPDDVLKVLGAPGVQAAPAPRAPRSPRAKARRAPSRELGGLRPERVDDGSLSFKVLRAVLGGARYLDEIVGVLDASLPEVSHALLLLTLSGEVDQGPGGVITISRR